MRGPLIMLAVFGAVYVLATLTRQVFLADVVPIAYAEVPQSMWALDGAFLLRSLENISILGIIVVLVIAVSQWLRNRRPAA